MPHSHARSHRDSGELAIHKLDWLKAAIIGLSDREVAILRDIADIDGHTASYMREVLETQVPAHSASNTFLTLWNKEEFKNCQDMAKLFSGCGINIREERAKDQRGYHRLAQWFARSYYGPSNAHRLQ
jgi:hypoxanthine-guanine phosphoribosyltransferase